MIQHSEDYIDINNIDRNINNLYSECKSILEHRAYLYKRFSRRDYKTDNVQVPLEYYISTIASGYFGGKEPQYNVKRNNNTQQSILKKVFDKKYNETNNPDEYQAIIDYITKYNDNSAFFYDCVKDYMNTGACYGLIYENIDNEIVYSHVSSLNCVAIWNYDTPLSKIGLVRIWIETDLNNTSKTHIEIITKNYKRHYIEFIPTNENSIKDEKTFIPLEQDSQIVLWNDLPVFAVENEDGLAIYENVLQLIDKFEQIIKNNADTFKYNDEAKLQITGYMPQNKALIEQKDKEGKIVLDKNGNPVMIKNPARELEDKQVLKAKVFYTPDGNGHIDWIIKDINDTASENHKKTCLDLALMISGVPNVTDQGFTNADNSSALEKKFFPLDQVLQQADKSFKKELLRMWEMITDRINNEKNTNYDFRDIEIILSRNLPANNNEVITNWLKLRGLISDGTIIDNLPFDLDSESEKAKLDEQNEENIKQNLKNMQMLGQDKDNTSIDDKENAKNKDSLIRKE